MNGGGFGGGSSTGAGIGSGAGTYGGGGFYGGGGAVQQSPGYAQQSPEYAQQSPEYAQQGGGYAQSAPGTEPSYAAEPNSDAVPRGYIRYRGQLMTLDQYEQALSASAGSNNPTLSRRNVVKRQTDGEPKKEPAKVLMCINGDPLVPPIKFNTMTGLRIREASAQQDGVVQITNLPNYQLLYMPFLPTAEMWDEQQALMLAQEDMIEKNMTKAPPPSD